METEKRKGKGGWIFLAICFFVVIACCVNWYLLKGKTGHGTFGDMFGVSNALFSGLAFAGVIYAILLQRKELELQREELKLTRGELKGQKEQLEAQNKTLKKQNFENTFFQLLRLHNEIVNALEYKQGSATFNGRTCFKRFFVLFTGRYNNNSNEQVEAKRISLAYSEFYNEPQNDVGHYFRNLYAIVNFIESSAVENLELYVNLIRVQLSNNELLLLFYHSLSDSGEKRLKLLIEKYALFESLPNDKLLHEKHKPLYKDGAYTDIWTVI